MAESELPVEVERLIRYFEGVERESPGKHWRNGAAMCRRWRTMLTGQPTQVDIDEFVARLEAEPNYGSAWLELTMQFRHWARRRGLRASAANVGVSSACSTVHILVFGVRKLGGATGKR